MEWVANEGLLDVEICGHASWHLLLLWLQHAEPVLVCANLFSVDLSVNNCSDQGLMYVWLI
jgi:hypothetical protein